MIMNMMNKSHVNTMIMTKERFGSNFKLNECLFSVVSDDKTLIPLYKMSTEIYHLNILRIIVIFYHIYFECE